MHHPRILPHRASKLLAIGFLLLSVSTFAQDATDYTALGDPSYAQSLGLSDEQVSQVARILDQRRNQVVAAKPEDRTAIFSAANKKLAGLLTDSQKRAFAELVSGANCVLALIKNRGATSCSGSPAKRTWRS